MSQNAEKARNKSGHYMEQMMLIVFLVFMLPHDYFMINKLSWFLINHLLNKKCYWLPTMQYSISYSPKIGAWTNVNL